MTGSEWPNAWENLEPRRGVKKCWGRRGEEMQWVAFSSGCDFRGLHYIPKRDGCAGAGKQLFDQLSHWQMLHCVWALRQCCDNLKCVCGMLCFRALALSRDIWHISKLELYPYRSWSSLWTLKGRGAWCRSSPEVTHGLVLSYSSREEVVFFFFSKQIIRDFSEVQGHN